MNEPLSCPVSDERVNENIVRLIAFEIVILTAFTLLTGAWVIAAAMTIDFALRAFSKGNASPLKIFTNIIAGTLRLSPRMIDAAPKRFSAGLGMVFGLLIAFFLFAGYALAAEITGYILIFCALLESVLGYCLGCKVYTYLILPFKK